MRRHAPPEVCLAPVAMDLASLETNADDDKRRTLVDALSKSNRDRSRAARSLGVSRRTLDDWLERFELDRGPGSSP